MCSVRGFFLLLCSFFLLASIALHHTDVTLPLVFGGGILDPVCAALGARVN